MEKKNIYQAMAEIMRSVEAIKKEKINKQGEGFKYRGIDDVMNSLHVAFSDAGVFITSEVLDRKQEERKSSKGNPLFFVTIPVKYTFHAEDGSSISTMVYGTAMDSGDKADNKCMSIALKYALLQTFLIPTEDMPDPDAETHELQKDNRPELNEKQYNVCIGRIISGDLDVAEKTKKAFKIKPLYLEGIDKAVQEHKEPAEINHSQVL
jgi:hypothetical protein